MLFAWVYNKNECLKSKMCYSVCDQTDYDEGYSRNMLTVI